MHFVICDQYWQLFIRTALDYYFFFFLFFFFFFILPYRLMAMLHCLNWVVIEIMSFAWLEKTK